MGMQIMIRPAVVVAALVAGMSATPVVAAQGATASSPVDADPATLKPGQFIWNGDVAPEGPMTVIVNLPSQIATVYRNGVRIGATTVSTGKKGHRTPTGIFTILQKSKDHRSNLYNNAPMPYMQRLTWDGIAMHAGNLPGYPASHGCIRMPLAFAKLLYAASSLGMTVVVSDDKVVPEMAGNNAFLAPVAASGPQPSGSTATADTSEKGNGWWWNPAKSPSGPVTIVMSTVSQKVVVYRNGVEIGSSSVKVADGFELGTRALQYAGTAPDGQTQWVYLPLPGYTPKKGQIDERTALQQIALPPEFNRLVHAVIGPGTTVLATTAGMHTGSSGKATTVIATQ